MAYAEAAVAPDISSAGTGFSGFRRPFVQHHDYETLGAGLFELQFSAGRGNFGGTSANCVTGSAPCVANSFGLVPFTSGRVFTLTADVNEGVDDSSLDRSFVVLKLNDIQVFDPAMNPLGTVTSGRVVVGGAGARPFC
jgi:hypothetical protein